MFSGGRRLLFLVGLVTAIGFLLRLHQYGQSMMGDEISTLWVISDRSLSDVVSIVRSNAEITPPLSFILSWFATKLGSDPNLIRLPALIAGTATIPLIYVLGRRTVGQAAGLLGMLLFALSPFMSYFSGNGRGYALLILLLVGSTLAMLKAIEPGRRVGWWLLYAALSCLAMYSHYTGVFVLLGQFLWLLWFARDAWREATMANLLAVLFFLPWVPGALADFDSPTTRIMEAIQGDGFAAKRLAVEQWAFGHPLIDPSHFPGNKVMLVILAGIILAAIGAIYRWMKDRNVVEEQGSKPGRVQHGLALIVIIALAAPVGEALLMLVGTDLFGARNMAVSWYGFALAVSALLLAPGGVVTLLSVALVLSGFTVAAWRLFPAANQAIDARSAAELIEEKRRPGDVVVDRTGFKTTPVPLTPLDAYLDPGADFQPGLPEGEPPFLPFRSKVIPPAEEMSSAFAAAAGNRAFVLVLEDGTKDSELDLPPGAKVTSSVLIPAYIPTRLYTVEVNPAGAN